MFCNNRESLEKNTHLSHLQYYWGLFTSTLSVRFLTSPGVRFYRCYSKVPFVRRHDSRQLLLHFCPKVARYILMTRSRDKTLFKNLLPFPI